METVQAETPKEFLLQDSRGNVGDNLMFWGIQGNGYTSDIRLAQRYTEAAAFAQHESRSSDIPWPVEYLQAHVRSVVDMQYVKPDEVPAAVGGEPFYLQHPNTSHYIGNDILFLCADRKTYTTDLAKAGLFTETPFGATGRAWPKSYIDQKSRPAVDCTRAKLKEAMKLTTRQLRKPEKPYKERYRCHGCGIFITAETYYCSPCPKCTTENRP